MFAKFPWQYQNFHYLNLFGIPQSENIVFVSRCTELNRIHDFHRIRLISWADGNFITRNKRFRRSHLTLVIAHTRLVCWFLALFFLLLLKLRRFGLSYQMAQRNLFSFYFSLLFFGGNQSWVCLCMWRCDAYIEGNFSSSWKQMIKNKFKSQ